MRRRSLEAQILAGLAVTAAVAVAVPVVYVGISEGTDAVRAGLPTRALQMGGAALVAAVVAVVALAAYSHWLGVTERPHERHEQRVPTLPEVVAVGVVVTVVVLAAWPVTSQVYTRSLEALADADYFWTVGYGALGLVYLWFALWSVGRYIPWVRLRAR
ncbi:MAG TPA: hypothetical protein VFZ64_00440 [Nocardioidaceae bacterium]